MNLDAFFQAEVKPALGCTEPGAVALAAAYAGRAHGGTIEKIKLTLSVNVYKNGRSVMLPHTGGSRGTVWPLPSARWQEIPSAVSPYSRT